MKKYINQDPIALGLTTMEESLRELNHSLSGWIEKAKERQYIPKTSVKDFESKLNTLNTE